MVKSTVMRVRGHLTLLAVILTLLWGQPPTSSAQVVDAVCPSDDIGPSCKCTGTGPVTLDCDSMESQSKFDEIIAAFHRAAGGEDSILRLESMKFAKVNFPSWDLTGLTRFHLESLKIEDSPSLTTIPKYSSGANKLTVTKSIAISGTGLSNEAVGNLLGYLDPEKSQSLKEFEVTGCPNIKNGEPGPQIISGLDLFKTLHKVDLSNNQIEDIAGGAFAGFKELRKIILKDNKIQSLGKGAFEIDFLDPRNETLLVYIELGGNKLAIDKANTKNSFADEFLSSHSKNVLYILRLENNQLETFPEETFRKLMSPQGFLDTVNLAGNPMFCDDKMEWLREATSHHEITGIDCTNAREDTMVSTTGVTGNDNQTTKPDGGKDPAGDASLMSLSSFLLFAIVVNALDFRHKDD